jgi:cyclophilin family peptidyl-prolyl cis-trans isomerase
VAILADHVVGRVLLRHTLLPFLADVGGHLGYAACPGCFWIDLQVLDVSTGNRCGPAASEKVPDLTHEEPMSSTRNRPALAVAATVAAVALVVAGAQALRPSSAPTNQPGPVATADGEVVPWALRLAPQNAGLVAFEELESATPCSRSDLRAEAQEPREEPAKDGRLPLVRVTVLVVNHGPTCSLPPEADGGLLDGDGELLPLSHNAGRAGPAYSAPPPLESGASASTDLTWVSWCGDDPGRWSVDLEVGGERTPVEVPGDDPPVPTCLKDTTDGLYGFGRWTVLNPAGQPAQDPQSALTATVTGPDSGRLGEVLPMVLRLSNPTRGPVPLQPCPSFTWSVSRSGPGSFLRSSPPLELNCPDAPGEVPAGGSVDFALELELSPALADGMLTAGDWWVHPALLDTEPRRIAVLPAQEGQPKGPADCTWVVPPDADPRVEGLPPTSVPRTVREAVLRTNRGDLTLELDGVRSPCAVAAFAHHVEGGYWNGQPCYLLSAQSTFRNVDCGSPELSAVRAGFAFPSEARAGTDYPAGTVVLTHNETIPHAGSIRILYGDAPTYADNFTVLGRITGGLEVVEQVAAGGQKDGEYGGPRQKLTISGIELLG